MKHIKVTRSRQHQELSGTGSIAGSRDALNDCFVVDHGTRFVILGRDQQSGSLDVV